ncbi:sugar ABC transporter substrate-binding protein [Azospirillum thermophilum]|uniref:Probable sugar-binding periplasmic protein n=2 Tax=Azospirillum thermophilum TaxID=2202148 RepID=A0A2S2CVQ9_9PROT|nr:sugar ABC transporter substrate-binding protein [Azospirillum thermophilum]
MMSASAALSAAMMSAAMMSAAALSAGPAAAEPRVEVLHYWTSGGESRAVAVLKQDFEAAGGTWKDAPVAGGGGDAAATVLRSRALAGVPPTVVQLKGPNIKDWASEGVLVTLDDVAAAEHWDALQPAALQEVVKYQGHYVAVPVNIHKVNWIWANPAVLARVGARVPQSWEEFNATADRLKAAGIVPLAHGGQPWQDATLFETVVLGIGGADFFRRALVGLDEAALRSDTMIRVFDQMRRLRGYVDPGFSGRDWNLATAMVMNGEAAMQIMGDWAKGEFLAAGRQPGRDFLCAHAPGAPGFILNSDSFVMFKGRTPDQAAGQTLLARLVFGPKFQETFNLYKGSIPARLDTPRDRFDVCAQQAMEDLKSSMEDRSLVPSMAHEIAVPGAVRGAILDVVTEHFNTGMTSAQAVDRLVATIGLAR